MLIKLFGFSRLFVEHPASVGETYAQHLRTALRFGIALLGAGLVCTVHALLPWIWKTKASDTVRLLYDHMIAGRRGRM